MSNLQNLTPKQPRWVKAFLAALADLGNVRHACEVAKVSRPVVYALRNSDESFAAEWERAQEEAADLLEKEARRRAEQGVRRLKFDRGTLIKVQAEGADGEPLTDEEGKPVMVPYVEHEYSDTLMIFLLKGIRPEKYRETTRTIQVNVTPDDLQHMSDDELDALDAQIKSLDRR